MNIAAIKLPQALADAAWAKLRMHADDPKRGVCVFCGCTECAVFRHARAELAMAGELDFDPIRDKTPRDLPALLDASASTAAAGMEAAGWTSAPVRPAAPNLETRREVTTCATTGFSRLSAITLRAAIPTPTTT